MSDPQVEKSKSRKNVALKPVDDNYEHYEAEELHEIMVPLGMRGETAVVYSHALNSVIDFGGYAVQQFYCIKPYEYWQNKYPTDKGGVKWDRAKSDVITLNLKIGNYDPTKVRGTGVWFDGTDLILNTGQELVINGERKTNRDIKSGRVYLSGTKLPRPKQTEATEEDLAPIVELIKGLSWQEPQMAYYLLGFIAIAPLAGALPVRPHIWLTGSAESGKTTVFEYITKRLLPFYGDYLGSTTEAGLRQAHGCNAIPVLIDEFETNDGYNSASRIQAVLELFRQAFSPTGAPITKGSAAGIAQRFNVAFCGMVSSIRVSLTDEADIGRFMVLELDSGKSADYGKVKHLLEHITPELRGRLWNRIFQMCPVILENQKLIYRKLRDSGCGDRDALKRSMLLAGYCAFINHGIIADFDFLKDCEIESLPKKALVDTESYECLMHLLSAKIRLATTDKGTHEVDVTVGFALDNPATHLPDNLKHHGIDFTDTEIMISNSHQFIKAAFRDTKWCHSFPKTLRRLPGAKCGQKVHRFRDIVSRFTVIPLSLLQEEGHKVLK